MELVQEMKKRYEELTALKEKTDTELKAVENYLQTIGELTPKRGRKPKTQN